MTTFVKVTEIWLPSKDRTFLEFGSGIYGTLTEFKATSETQRFAFNEGLPGKAWATGHPIVLKKFEESHFKRTKAAQAAGLTCGIALPIFSGDFLLAVVVFLCGDDQDLAGAIEVWCNHDVNAEVLQLIDGYYGSLEQFEYNSKQCKMTKNQGLPGLVWASGMPVLMDDISLNPAFIRSKDAASTGITTGLGIPVANNGNDVYIMTFLSAKKTPLAKRIQLWVPENGYLVCQQGFSITANDLAEIFETVSVAKGEGALGRVWLTGLPSITGYQDDQQYSPELDNLNSMLAIPVIERGCFKAIVTFLF